MPIQLQRIAAGCAALIFSAAAIPSHAQQIVVSKDNRTIAVTTSADANADADTVTVQIGFVAYGADQDSAYATGSKISNAIAAALKAAGIPQDAIQSESQSIAPVQQFTSQEWTPQERADRKFQVQQSWNVKTAAAKWRQGSRRGRKGGRQPERADDLERRGPGCPAGESRKAGAGSRPADCATDGFGSQRHSGPPGVRQ